MTEPPITIDLPASVLNYPQGPIRWVLKAPLLVYRLGLGRLLPPTFLLLTTTGRTSGTGRTVALETRRHGSRRYVISVWGARADWYRNLLANPVVRVQVAGETYAAQATPITNHDELWRVLGLFRKGNPLVDAILEGTVGLSPRATPDELARAQERLAGVCLEPLPADTAAPQGLRADLVWVWAVLPVLAAGLVALFWPRQNTPD